jgi:metal-sulfur cluster biosynthetic enzyme
VTTAGAAVTEERVMAALASVRDPEIGLDVVELGLIYDVAIDDATVHVTMTLTAEGCPLHAVMTDWVRAAVREVPGVEHVDVQLTFDPPWTPDRMRRR